MTGELKDKVALVTGAGAGRETETLFRLIAVWNACVIAAVGAPWPIAQQVLDPTVTTRFGLVTPSDVA